MALLTFLPIAEHNDAYLEFIFINHASLPLALRYLEVNNKIGLYNYGHTLFDFLAEINFRENFGIYSFKFIYTVIFNFL